MLFNLFTHTWTSAKLICDGRFEVEVLKLFRTFLIYSSYLTCFCWPSDVFMKLPSFSRMWNPFNNLLLLPLSLLTVLLLILATCLTCKTNRLFQCVGWSVSHVCWETGAVKDVLMAWCCSNSLVCQLATGASMSRAMSA